MRPGTVAELLKQAENGKKISLDLAMPQIYDELHRLASTYMSRERNSHTLQPTALVNETYLKLVAQHSVDFSNRAQLLGVSAQMMRRILKMHETARQTNKRGGDVTIVGFSDSNEPAAGTDLFFGEVDQLLDRMAVLDARQAKVVELRIFGGLTLEEIAEFMDISVATAHRDWTSGRLWLADGLQK